MASHFSFNNIFHSFSKTISEEKGADKKLTPRQKSHQQEIENSILVLTAAVIRCDKNFTSDVEKFILEFLSLQFGEHRKAHRINTITSHIESGTEPFTKIACKELKVLTTYDSRISILNFLFGIAAADDFANAKEIRCIHRIASYLGISEKDFGQAKEIFQYENSPHKILGVDSDASVTEIKTAYRKLVLKFHPDKNKNDAEAETKFRKIKHAFEMLNK